MTLKCYFVFRESYPEIMPCADCIEVKAELAGLKTIVTQWFQVLLKEVQSSRDETRELKWEILEKLEKAEFGDPMESGNPEFAPVDSFRQYSARSCTAVESLIKGRYSSVKLMQIFFYKLRYEKLRISKTVP